ncbi:hypothetical protein BVC80_605g2 [Macleaya cordata]|uniref:Uncharacterized protein n=1 Tax=Macleaya cordata TaxID=56857 RepID=A0A200R0F5_MACCD|nr:hypothetical protein BVC80_605g2 [Macleaya cordata]
MIKRQFYKQEHDNDGDDVSDSSSSSSSSESDSEDVPEAQEEIEQVEEEEEDSDAVAEAEEDDQPSSPSLGSGYNSEDSSANEVDFGSSGSLLKDDDEIKSGRENLNNSQLTSKNNIETVETDAAAREDSIQADLKYRILKCGSVFKCRLCPRIVCLSEETLRAHLVSKRHARSEKLLSEGRLKFMLNSDGEVEEDPETHAERHARTLAIAQELSSINTKNKGRQRQRLRLKRKKTREVPNKGKDKKQSVKSPAKKRRKNED